MREGETTLVVYSYRHADPEALGNLQHFVSAVIKPQDPARYIIVVDQAMQQHGHMSAHGLPQLSANAEYLTIRDCFELGHVGKVLLGEKSSVHVSVEQYKYFVWLDSSAKGPLLPTNTLQGDHASAWHTLLTSRITATTKLVGANIVCEPIREDLMPYVEATVMATDTVGLQVLQKAKCFDCYATSHEAKMKGELAASAAVLDAGYNLDCFNPPNQGVNWRDKSAWPCAKTVRQHPQEAANSALASHVEKFRSQGGEGFEAQQSEEYDEVATGLAGEVAELDHDQGVDIAFYGDSITELWKYGLPETGGRSNVYWDNFGAYTSAILAVAGDQTSNLWWRMLHGETFEQHPPQMSVLLIGINDLAIAASCGASFVTDAADGIAQRITSMVSHLQHVNPDSEVLMVGILPCAAETSPGPEGLFAWPNGLSAGISQVNAALEGFASQHHLVHYVDCTDEMLLQGQISESVLPDGLHPNAEGMARLASCLSPIISRYVKPQQNA
ncbi:hypothetical protein WJX79_007386 [Trebouxia sp. C0005]